MKKAIISTFLIAAAILCSCTKEKPVNPYEKESAIKIINSDVLFPATASEGSITVEAKGPVSATTESDWCELSISGQTILVSVPQNGSIEGRSATVTIRCGEDSVTACVQQEGLIFSCSAGNCIVVNDEEGTYNYTLKSNVALRYSTGSDWFTMGVVNDRMTVKVKANDTKHYRSGWIYYRSDSFVDSLRIVQIDLEKEFAGTCYLRGNNASTGVLTQLTCNLEVVGKSDLELHYEPYGWTIPMEFDASSLTMKLRGGQFLGMYDTSYYVFSVIWDIKAGYLTWSDSVTMTGDLKYAVSSGKVTTSAYFLSDGSWTYKPTVYSIQAFKTSIPSSTSRYNSIIALENPYILIERQ